MNPANGLQGRVPLALVHDYYSHQAGGGVGSVFAGQRYQRGHGLGSFFGGLFRSAMPLITRGLRALGRQALSSGGEVLADVMQGQPLKESFMARARDGAHVLGGQLKRKLDDLQSGAGAKRLKLGGTYMVAGTRKHPHFFGRNARGQKGKTCSRRGGRVRKTISKRGKKQKKKKKVARRRKTSSKRTTDIFDSPGFILNRLPAYRMMAS